MRLAKTRSILKRHQPLGDAASGNGAIVPALFASLVVQFFRIEQHRSLALMCSEFVLFTLLSIGMSFLARKWFVANKAKMKQLHAICISQVGALLIVMLFLVWQYVARAIGFGDPNEIVALLVLQYLAFYLALVGFVPGCDRASLVLGGSLVFFVCCMTERTEIFCLAGVFTVIALWGLLGLYWSRLDSKAIDGQSRMLSIHGTSIAVASLVMLMAIGLAFLVPMSDAATAIRGFMPFSGGEDGYDDPFARDGIGDGELLIGGANATTTGAVDTDYFIEDHKPSLYDVMSEKYDGPIAKRRRNRAVSLEAESRHLHDLKQSEMAGKTFRTMRESGKTSDRKLENRVTDALFFVEGTAPARFATRKFQSFDGWDWHAIDIKESNPKPPAINLKRLGGKPVFTLARSRRDFLPGDRVHRIKMMRLEANELLSVSFLDSWHIANVDKADFFAWNEHGQVCYDGEFIPPQTVIDMRGLVPNYHIMRKLGDLRKNFAGSTGATLKPVNKVSPADSPYLQVPESSKREQLKALVADWTTGIEPGWNQVEAIVDHVRTEFKLNPAWDADPTIDNTVDHFLDQKGGPELMFPTTCVMALRLAGYRTRMVEGYVVRKSDYDRVARQSVVDGSNAHMWPEVCLDGRFWIPVEPTPGYPVPFSVETLWQKLIAAIFGFLRWVYQHPIGALMTLSSVIFVIVYRVRFVTVGLLVWWHIVKLIRPAGLLPATRQLIDARFWAAGQARPASQTISRWYSRVEPDLPRDFFEFWNARNYSESSQPINNDILVASCYEQLQLLTLQKIRDDLPRNRNGDV